MGASHFWISASSTSRAASWVWASQDLISATTSKTGDSQPVQHLAQLMPSQRTYGSPARCCRKGTPCPESDVQDDFSALVFVVLFKSREILNGKRVFFPSCCTELFPNNMLHNMRMQSEELCLESQRILWCYYVPHVLQWRIFWTKKSQTKNLNK